MGKKTNMVMGALLGVATIGALSTQVASLQSANKQSTQDVILYQGGQNATSQGANWHWSHTSHTSHSSHSSGSIFNPR